MLGFFLEEELILIIGLLITIFLVTNTTRNLVCSEQSTRKIMLAIVVELLVVILVNISGTMDKNFVYNLETLSELRMKFTPYLLLGNNQQIIL